MKFLKAVFNPRDWEDAIVNGIVDEDGDLIPFRNGESVEFIIDLENGCIKDWPSGINANIHYKVCDQGEYLILDHNMNALYQYKSSYVPDEYLCHGDNGYGDYIIMNINEDGLIENYSKPTFNEERWIEYGV